MVVVFLTEQTFYSYLAFTLKNVDVLSPVTVFVLVLRVLQRKHPESVPPESAAGELGLSEEDSWRKVLDTWREFGGGVRIAGVRRYSLTDVQAPQQGGRRSRNRENGAAGEDCSFWRGKDREGLDENKPSGGGREQTVPERFFSQWKTWDMCYGLITAEENRLSHTENIFRYAAVVKMRPDTFFKKPLNFGLEDVIANRNPPLPELFLQSWQPALAAGSSSTNCDRGFRPSKSTRTSPRGEDAGANGGTTRRVFGGITECGFGLSDNFFVVPRGIAEVVLQNMTQAYYQCWTESQRLSEVQGYLQRSGQTIEEILSGYGGVGGDKDLHASGGEQRASKERVLSRGATASLAGGSGGHVGGSSSVKITTPHGRRTRNPEDDVQDDLFDNVVKTDHDDRGRRRMETTARTRHDPPHQQHELFYEDEPPTHAVLTSSLTSKRILPSAGLKSQFAQVGSEFFLRHWLYEHNIGVNNRLDLVDPNWGVFIARPGARGYFGNCSALPEVEFFMYTKEEVQKFGGQEPQLLR